MGSASPVPADFLANIQIRQFLFQALGWMGFQNSKGALSELQNKTESPTRCQESTEVLFVQMTVEVSGIFSAVTFQIFRHAF